MAQRLRVAPPCHVRLCTVMVSKISGPTQRRLAQCPLITELCGPRPGPFFWYEFILTPAQASLIERYESLQMQIVNNFKTFSILHYDVIDRLRSQIYFIYKY